MDLDSEISEHAAEHVRTELRRATEEYLELLKAAHPERWAAILAAQNKSPEPRF